MNNEQIIQEATEAVEKGLPCAYLVPHLLEVAKNQKLEIEILIRKKEALRDEIAEQQAEIERLSDGNHKCIYLSDDETTEYCVDGACSVYKNEAMIKSEAYREFAEKLKEISKEVTVSYVADTTIQEHKTGMFYYKREDFDNALNKLLSNDMGRYDHYTDSFVKELTESNE